MNAIRVLKMMVIVFILFIIAVSADDSVVCRHCSFKNEKSDRYCLECGKETREKTQAEQLKIQKDHEKRKERDQIIQKQLRKQNQIITICKNGEQVDLKQYAQKGSVTIFDFYADWCGPCLSLAPKLEQFVKDNNQVVLRKINIKKWGSPVAKQYQIKSIPSIWIYDQKGTLREKAINGLPAIKKAVKKLL